MFLLGIPHKQKSIGVYLLGNDGNDSVIPIPLSLGTPHDRFLNPPSSTPTRLHYQYPDLHPPIITQLLLSSRLESHSQPYHLSTTNPPHYQTTTTIHINIQPRMLGSLTHKFSQLFRHTKLCPNQQIGNTLCQNSIIHSNTTTKSRLLLFP